MSNQDSIPKYVPLATVAERLAVNVATVRRTAKKRGIPVVKIGSAQRIRIDHVPLLFK